MSRFITDKKCKACDAPSLYRLGPKKLGKTFICLSCGAMQAGLNTVVIGNTIRIGDLGGNPGAPVNGEIWLNGTTLRMYSGGTAQDIGSGSGTGVPTGVIAMWGGTLASVPAGWVLCDGLSSTPDLRDKFIYGWTAAVNPGSTGGATTHLHASGGTHQHSNDGPTSHTGTFGHSTNGAHQHASFSGSTSTVANHSHSIDTAVRATGTTDTGTFVVTNTTDPAGTHAHTMNHQHSSDGDHLHTAHTFSDHILHRHDSIGGHQHDTVSNLPPYYKLAFIMKS